MRASGPVASGDTTRTGVDAPRGFRPPDRPDEVWLRRRPALLIGLAVVAWVFVVALLVLLALGLYARLAHGRGTLEGAAIMSGIIAGLSLTSVLLTRRSMTLLREDGVVIDRHGVRANLGRKRFRFAHRDIRMLQIEPFRMGLVTLAAIVFYPLAFLVHERTKTRPKGRPATLVVWRHDGPAERIDLERFDPKDTFEWMAEARRQGHDIRFGGPGPDEARQ